MKANFINSTNYCDAFERIVAVINERKVDLDAKHLLIVPERYTLLAEQYLYEKAPGSFDVEVLSMSRLFYKLGVSKPLISRQGAIMMLRGMMPSVELKCFLRSASFRGFCEKLYDAINDFAGGGVLPDDIPDSSPKLSDLKTVYKEYLSRIGDKFVDRTGRLGLIADSIPTSEYLNNAFVYVANFDYTDRATRRVLDALRDRAVSYTECVVNFDLRGFLETRHSGYEKFYGEGAQAVKEVAKRLRYSAYCGIPYEDMAVIVGNADCARIKRILGEFDIPCFVAERKSLYDHALSTLIMKLVECGRVKRRDSMIALGKNLYFGFSKDRADSFENYVCEKLVDYKGFEAPFEGECEQTRSELVSVVDYVQRAMGGITDAAGLKRLIAGVFAKLGVEKTTEEVFGTDASIEKMFSLVDLMEQMGIRGDFEFVFSVFAEGLKATDMSTIPYSGGVIVGDPAAFRGKRYKFTAVIGFDDGFLPQIYDDSSLIGDDEKTFFTQMERSEEINSRYEIELAACLAASQRVFATYTEPSGMMEELFAHAPIVDDFDLDISNAVLSSGCKKHATELLITLVNRIKSGAEDNSQLINALYAATGADEKLFVSRREERISGAEKLFFPNGRTSVSQLQTYFSCPFKHFADYGLRLVEREKGEVASVDVGSFMHSVFERAMNGNKFDDIDGLVDEITREIVSEGGKLALPANAEKVELYKKEAAEVLKIYVRHLQKGSFTPLGQEIPFETKLGDIKIYGKIDMADTYGNFIRLIDYKTGSTDFDISDVYFGTKIQLPIYMAAAAEKGYQKAAMFLFPLAYEWLDNSLEHRFRGYMLGSPTIVDAVCGKFEGDSEVFSLKRKNGKLTVSGALLKDEEMDNMVGYAVKVASKATEEIKGGYVAPVPCGNVCTYCDYACLCADSRARKLYKADITSFEEEK